METVTFSHRSTQRARACAAAVALPVAMTLAAPAPAIAAGSSDTTKVVSVSGTEDIEVSAGETIAFDSTQGRTFTIPEQDASALPAGWSVIRGEDTLRVTASATAQPKEYATIEVKETSGETGTFRVVVGDDAPEEESASSSSSSRSSSSWIDRLAGRVASLFGV